MVRAYKRLGDVELKDVLDAIREGRPFVYKGIVCDTKSSRLLTYHVYGTKCCVPHCSVHGEYFAIETAANQAKDRYHLNLYGTGKDGREVMITSDHRLPKSKGGTNDIYNRQPMCYPHNTEKGNRLIYI